MKIVSQTKKSIVVELTPLELELMRGGMVRERNHRGQQWEKVVPRYPEELMYHSVMRESSEDMCNSILKAIKQYRSWGILK